jgi:hypothetical protein
MFDRTKAKVSAEVNARITHPIRTSIVIAVTAFIIAVIALIVSVGHHANN